MKLSIVLLGVKWLLRALQDPQNGSRIGLRMAILGYLGPLKWVILDPIWGPWFWCLITLGVEIRPLGLISPYMVIWPYSHMSDLGYFAPFARFTGLDRKSTV